MKTLALVGALLVCALVVPSPAHAGTSLYPGATLVQQAPTKMDACSLATSATGTAQQTVTITPPAGQFVYFCSIEVVSVSPTAPAASALIHTTTNLGGLKLFGGVTATGGVTDRAIWQGMGGSMLQSQVAGTAVTIVSNAAITNITYNVQATYFFAP